MSAVDLPRNERRFRPEIRVERVLANYGLLIFAVLVTLGFVIALPGSFLTVQTWSAILQSNYIVAILGFAEAICIACGEFDLSIANNLTLVHILCIGFVVNQHVPWYWAGCSVIVIGAVIGLVNGLLIYYLKINSFIVTLGVGTITLGFAYLYTGGLDILPTSLPSGYVAVENGTVFGVPAAVFPLVVIAVLLVILMEYLPPGRYIYALGANRRAAILAGVRPARYVIGVFVLSGLLVGIASILYSSQYRTGSLASAPNLLLPIFTAAMLGSSVIRPGRPNILGTIVAVVLLGVGLAGLLQLGYGVSAQDLFNGLALIVGVGIAGAAARRAVTVRSSSEATGTLQLPSLPEDASDIVPEELLAPKVDQDGVA